MVLNIYTTYKSNNIKLYHPKANPIRQSLQVEGIASSESMQNDTGQSTSENTLVALQLFMMILLSMYQVSEIRDTMQLDMNTKNFMACINLHNLMDLLW